MNECTREVICNALRNRIEEFTREMWQIRKSWRAISWMRIQIRQFYADLPREERDVWESDRNRPDCVQLFEILDLKCLHGRTSLELCDECIDHEKKRCFQSGEIPGESPWPELRPLPRGELSNG